MSGRSSQIARHVLPRVGIALLVVSVSPVGVAAAAENGSLLPVGAAKVEITPKEPVHLVNTLEAKESEGVAGRLWARAIAIGKGDPGPAVLISFDGVGVTREITRRVAERLKERKGVHRRRLVVTATHTHWAPHLSGLLPTIFGGRLPAEHRKHVRRYTDRLVDRLVRAGVRAVEDRRPCRLSRGRGDVGFAINRRKVKGGEYVGFGDNPDGPVDHRLPVLAARGPSGELRAVLLSYACHNTAISGNKLENKVHGDWAGLAAKKIEASHPGSVALVTLGCGGDARPRKKGGVAVAEEHAKTIADEVERLLGMSLDPVDGPLSCRRERVELPFEPLPDRETLRRYAAKAEQGRPRWVRARGTLAKEMLKRLDRGEKPSGALPYGVQRWVFDDDLAMVFLNGEVVVDYARRLRRELDGERLWTVAYANAVPCYIPSRSDLREGGYEAYRSMFYYGFLRRLAPETEQVVVDTVQKLLPHRFYSKKKRRRFPPPKPPEASRKTIETAADLTVDLVAAEPLVQDPVAFDWGPDGRLWVVEMRDFPLGKDPAWPEIRSFVRADSLGKASRQLDAEPAGRVKVLEDTDGDRRYDTATVFLDGLHLPTGIKVWRDGVLVATAPDILYAEDTDGDGRADRRRVLYSGFGTANAQHRVSSMRWGLDNRVHLCAGDRRAGGRRIRCKKTGETVRIGGRDAKIRPDAGTLVPRAGSTRFGHTRDDWGHWFGGGSHGPTWQYVLADRYVRRNPAMGAVSLREPVTSRAARVHPVGRPRLRYNRPEHAGRVTSACSRMIYRDEGFGGGFAGDLFVCEPAHGLVRRLQRKRAGLVDETEPTAGDGRGEFLAAADRWFRPVMVRTGPDGAIWVADMYRFLTEHPWDISEKWLRKLDLRAGAEKGRIYRIRPQDEPPRPMPDLTGRRAEGLVDALSRPNGWVRDMAHQMLLWRDDASAVEPLKRLATDGGSPKGRLHALCVLSGLGSLDVATLRDALDDPHAAVRRHAVRLAEGRLGSSPPLADAAVALVDDPSVEVRLQLALSLGEWKAKEAGDALGRLAVAAETPRVRTAVLSSATPHVRPITDALLGAEAGLRPRRAMVPPLVRTAAREDRMKAAARLVRAIAAEGEAASGAWRFDRMASAATALRRHGTSPKTLVENELGPDRSAPLTALWRAARETATDPDAASSDRAAAIRLLGRTPAGELVKSELETLAGLLGPKTPLPVQRAAVERLGAVGSDRVPDLLLARWARCEPKVRRTLVDTLLQRRRGAEALLDRIEKEPSVRTALTASQRQRLLRHDTAAVRKRAASLLEGATTERRAALVDRYLKDMEKTDGDAGDGKALFQKTCAVCHVAGGSGVRVGPKLTTLSDRSAERLVTAILDPNRAVSGRYTQYVATLTDGRTLSGVVAEETASGLTLIAPDGTKHRIARDRLRSLTATNRSPMPEGLEASITPADMADLVAYLQQLEP